MLILKSVLFKLIKLSIFSSKEEFMDLIFVEFFEFESRFLVVVFLL
jgi:hypothetical protein